MLWGGFEGARDRKVERRKRFDSLKDTDVEEARRLSELEMSGGPPA